MPSSGAGGAGGIIVVFKMWLTSIPTKQLSR